MASVATKLEHALRESESRFRSAFEHAPIGMALLTPDGRAIRVNRALCDMLGYSEAELLTMTSRDITHPDDIDEQLELRRRALAGEIEGYELEKRFVRRDGEPVWAITNVALVRDGNGEPLHFVTHVRNTTEVRRAASALALSEQRFRGAFESAPIGMALTAPDGRFLRVNRALCDILGYAEDELVGAHFQAISHPDDLQENLDLLARALRGELGAFRLQKRYRHKQGHDVWADLTASIVRDANGEPAYMVAQVIDVSERRRAEQTLHVRDAVLEAVASSAESLLRAERWEDAILDVLRDLGLAVGVSRAYLFSATGGAGAYVVSRTHEWTAEGIDPQGAPVLAARVPEGLEAEWIDELGRGRVVQGHRREFTGATAEFLAEQGIRSLMLVPVQVADRFWGFLGFDECSREREWTSAESEALRAAAGALGAAIQRRQAEERRRELEMRYRTLVEQLPLTTYIDLLDESMSPVFISPQIVDVLGYTVDEWMTDPTLFTRILHPDDRHAAIGPWPADDGPHRYEYRLIARDGREVWFLDEYTIVRDEAGRRRYAQGYMVDITERRRMEEELRRANELLQTVVHASPLAIILTDADDLVTFWNPAAESLYGWSSREVVGKPIPMRPAERDREYEGFRDAGERRQWVAGFETQRVRKDGSTIDVSISLAPLHDDSGSLVGLLGIHEDITERKHAQDSLREREQHFRAVFDSGLDGMAIFDDDRRYLQANEALARLHGLPREAFNGLRIDDVVIPEDLASLEADWRAILERDVSTGETEIERPDGSRRQIEYTVRANFLPGRHLAVVHDVTERRHLESRLLQSQRLEAVGRLAGGIAHDFNNLLTAISGYGEFLFDALADSDPLRRDVEEIQRAADRAAALIRQLLAFSRRQLMRPRVVDLNEVIADTETMLRRLIGEDVELVTALDPELSPIRADPAQLEQIVVNLAVNARDAMPAGGVLSIRTENVPAAGAVRLTVGDTGEGMDAETAAHAFEPFFTTKEPGKGTGLGLSTVYGIVAQSGGTVEVRSEPGAGATFTILLPAFEEAAPAPAAESRPATDASASETLLLVEDEPIVRELAQRVLESSGYAVLAAASGDEALTVASSYDGEIALLVTDVVMPGMSGRELAERLRTIKPGLRVLYTSGYTDDDAFADSSRTGVFLGKPFRPEALRRKVRELLDQTA